METMAVEVRVERARKVKTAWMEAAPMNVCRIAPTRSAEMMAAEACVGRVGGFFCGNSCAQASVNPTARVSNAETMVVVEAADLHGGPGVCRGSMRLSCEPIVWQSLRRRRLRGS